MKGNCGECNRRWACDVDPDKCNEWPDPAPMTNADRISTMAIEEKAKFLDRIAYARETPWSEAFAEKFCRSCPVTRCEIPDYLNPLFLHECDFVDGKCPHGNSIVWWLQQPAEEDDK